MNSQAVLIKPNSLNLVIIEPRDIIRQAQVALIATAKDTADDDIKANILLRIGEVLDNTVRIHTI